MLKHAHYVVTTGHDGCCIERTGELKHPDSLSGHTIPDLHYCFQKS